MRRTLTDDVLGTEFEQAIYAATRSLWRWEQQPAYWVGYENAAFEAFLTGKPQPPAEMPHLHGYLNRIAQMTAAGVAVGRVRVVDEPIPDYQRWMRWLDPWNREAGETIDYLPRARLVEIGPPPFEPAADWWFVDDQRLLLMHFDDTHRRVKVELLENEPEIELAKQWRDLVVAEARRGSQA